MKEGGRERKKKKVLGVGPKDHSANIKKKKKSAAYGYEEIQSREHTYLFSLLVEQEQSLDVCLIATFLLMKSDEKIAKIKSHDYEYVKVFDIFFWNEDRL